MGCWGASRSHWKSCVSACNAHISKGCLIRPWSTLSSFSSFCLFSKSLPIQNIVHATCIVHGMWQLSSSNKMTWRQWLVERTFLGSALGLWQLWMGRKEKQKQAERQVGRQQSGFKGQLSWFWRDLKPTDSSTLSPSVRALDPFSLCAC